MNKKIIVVLLSIFFIIISFSVTINVFASQKISSSDKIILEFSFSKPIIEQLKVDEDIITTVTIESLQNTYDLGKPIIPVKPVKVLLPQGTEVNDIEITTSEEILLGSGFNIQAGGYIAPVSLIENENKQTITTKYSSDIIESFVGVYTFRGFSILHLNLYPVKYDALNGKISYFNSIKLTIDIKNCDVNKAFRNDINDFEIVENLVENPEILQTYKSTAKSLSDEDYKYIIITNNDLKNSDEDYTFQDLIDFKTNNGVSAKIATTEEIMSNPDFEVDGKWGDANPENPFYNSPITSNLEQFNDKPARIRNYIRYAYSELETEYVLLGGDADIANENENIIPFRGLFANESGLPLNPKLNEVQDDIPSDIYYACLDGNFNYDCDDHFGESPDRNNAEEIDEADLYAEVWVGRCCADSDKEVSNFVYKTLNYSKSSDPYLSEIMFIGERVGNGFYFEYGGGYKDMIEYLIPSIYNMHKLYDSINYNWSPDDLINELDNVQPQIINHYGHGYTNSMLKMTNIDFYKFENKKPFFIYSSACLTGAFDNYMPYIDGYSNNDCIAEILTCEITYGSFACILNSRYGLGSTNTPESPSGSYDESFYNATFTENIKELGKANHYSKEDNIWRINENGYRWVYYETNLFGDPQLRLRSFNNPPNKPSVRYNRLNQKIIIRAIDPDKDLIRYGVSWDNDGTVDQWTDLVKSGTKQKIDCKDKSGNVGVVVEDEYGAQSQWFLVKSKYKTIEFPVLNFFISRFTINFPMFEKILKQII